MYQELLDLPARISKPRTNGLTMVIDSGMPSCYFEDAITSAAEHVDIVKFGWGTSLVTHDLPRKLDVLQKLGIRYYFGGTLFEKFVLQDRFESFLSLCRRCGTDLIEVSNGTIPLDNTAKAAYIRKCTDEFTVVSEVGFKDAGRSQRLAPSQWIDYIAEDIEAGASLVICEARESGRSGICRQDGELRWGLIEDILASQVPVDRLVFEAPTKELQAHFVTRIGPNVNLGNIALGEILGLETLRLGLRADTLLELEGLLVDA